MSNSQFQNNTSTNGGAISATTTFVNTIAPQFKIESSEFFNNKAEKGGAIYVSNHKMEIINSVFEENRAIHPSHGSGGCIYL